MSIFKSVHNKLIQHSVDTELAMLDPNNAKAKKRGATIMTALLVGSMASMPALAGTGGDALLKDTFDSSMGVIQGYGAKLTTGVSGAFAMIGSVFKFQPQLIASTLGVGFTGAGVDNAIDFTVTGLLF
ncbi:hypothetical protein [Vibrio vulnificus]|uniref:hypothetical protein n=1 Tax=Vibrio vulnificus TaxID=672 RepID=UPI00102352CF|nr:hypothetical protein [Vibrio vulnificus]EHZ2651907.1 hypothetical protein [Vibrio vulnificus]MCU8194299.1 hypothetical protein [Vibrio vulnificus]RZQ33239.1 hypothetical protein D8T38_18525 [Vibrio vulnificus]HAS6231033.1 hypothetical protein [Vibrio vulnificus]HDY7776789.1 hypothetical protein [Vibrio vulnificus]